MSSHGRSWALISAHELSNALMSMLQWHHECSWVLMSAHSPMAPCSLMLLSSNECSLLHCAKLLGVHGCLRVIMSNHERSWAPISTHKQSKAAISDPDYQWANEHSWAAINMAAWSNEHSGELKSSLEHWAMKQWELFTHERTWCHSTILMSALKYS